MGGYNSDSINPESNSMPLFDAYGNYNGTAQPSMGDAIASGAGFANQLSSQNAQASYYPQAMVQQAQLALQGQQVQQQGLNQRLGAIAPLLAAIFGGSHGGSGFTSNFGQAVH